MVLIRFYRVLLRGLWRLWRAQVRRETFPYEQHTAGMPLEFLCTLFDCDINLHMNNSIYLRLMDMGRWHWCFQSGAVMYFQRMNLRPVAGRVDIAFRKPLPPFRKLLLETRMIEAKGKRVIFEQVFLRPRDRALYARALVEVALLQNNKSIEVSAFASWCEPPASVAVPPLRP